MTEANAQDAAPGGETIAQPHEGGGPLPGCYLVEYVPKNQISGVSRYYGTIRVERQGYQLVIDSGGDVETNHRENRNQVVIGRVPDDKYALHLTSLRSVDEIPDEHPYYRNVVLVAKIKDDFHLRIFDSRGRVAARHKKKKKRASELLPDPQLAVFLEQSFESSEQDSKHQKLYFEPDPSAVGDEITPGKSGIKFITGVLAPEFLVNDNTRVVLYDLASDRFRVLNTKEADNRIAARLESVWAHTDFSELQKNELLAWIAEKIRSFQPLLEKTASMVVIVKSANDLHFVIYEQPESKRQEGAPEGARHLTEDDLTGKGSDSKKNRAVKESLEALKRWMESNWEIVVPATDDIAAKARLKAAEILGYALRVRVFDRGGVKLADTTDEDFRIPGEGKFGDDGEKEFGELLSDIKSQRIDNFRKLILDQFEGLDEGTGREAEDLAEEANEQIRESTIETVTSALGLSRVNKLVASGDLYQWAATSKYSLSNWVKNAKQRQTESTATGETNAEGAGRAENDGLGIPTFPREDYAFYLQLTDIIEATPKKNEFTADFDVHCYNHPSRVFRKLGQFVFVGAKKDLASDPRNALAALCEPKFGSNYFEGKVKAKSGAITGSFKMGWISPHFREATLQIDCIGDSPDHPPAPLGESGDSGKNAADSGHDAADRTWTSVFKEIQWYLRVVESNSWTLKEPGSGDGRQAATRVLQGVKPDPAASWSFAELHKAMQALDDSTTLDEEWRYHLLCVTNFQAGGRGISYDVGRSDLNATPREGIAIASDYVFPQNPKVPTANDDLTFHEVAGKKFYEQLLLYFRTAVHELGHLMNLGHNQGDLGFMNATNVIAYNPPLKRVAGHALAHLDLMERYRQIGRDPNLEPPLDSEEAEPEPISESRRWEKSTARPARSRKRGPSGTRPIMTQTYKPGDDAGDIEQKAVSNIARKLAMFSPKQFGLITNELTQKTVVEVNQKLRVLNDELIEEISAFPDNVVYRFHPDDEERLKHGPDVMVRPGTPFHGVDSPLNPPRRRAVARGLVLDVGVPLEKVPLGAPVRVDFKLTNTTDRSANPRDLYVPRRLSLKRGHVHGQVLDAHRRKRTFTPLMVEDDDDGNIEALAPGRSRGHSITLLRGDYQGNSESLFPTPGVYTVVVEVNWELYGNRFHETGKTARFSAAGGVAVEVTRALDDEHREIADEIISNKDMLLAFAFRLRLDEDLSAESRIMTRALRSPLRDHYGIVRANQYYDSVRNGNYCDETKPRVLEEALKAIDSNTVLSLSELWRILRISKSALRYPQLKETVTETRADCLTIMKQLLRIGYMSKDDPQHMELYGCFYNLLSLEDQPGWSEEKSESADKGTRT